MSPDQETHLFELAAIVFGLTEIFKEFIPRKFRRKATPLLAILLGGLGNIYLMGYSPQNLVYGLALGLAASGLYKAARNVMFDSLSQQKHHTHSTHTKSEVVQEIVTPASEATVSPTPVNPAPLITEPATSSPRSLRSGAQEEASEAKSPLYPTTGV